MGLLPLLLAVRVAETAEYHVAIQTAVINRQDAKVPAVARERSCRCCRQRHTLQGFAMVYLAGLLQVIPWCRYHGKMWPMVPLLLLWYTADG